mgnify:CR=1 FL=1
MSIEAVVDDVIIRGLNDLIQASEIAYVTTYLAEAKSNDQVRETVLLAVQKLLLRGLMEVGDIVSEPCPYTRAGSILDVAAWDLSPSQAIERIDREWRALGRRPSLGELFWLKNTMLGNQTAMKLLELRGGNWIEEDGQQGDPSRSSGGPESANSESEVTLL